LDGRLINSVARQAAAQTDPQLKEDFLDMERRWESLARSYEFTARLLNGIDHISINGQEE
jgi:hypothetical protein